MVRSGFFGLLASFALVASAQAADLPSEKGPALYAPPPPVFSWTGVYVGVTAGGAFGHETLSDNGVGRLGANSAGFIGGGEAGFNYQMPTSNVVLGGETDFQGSTLRSSYGALATPGGGPLTGTSNLDWWGSARARLGLSFGNVLPYVTGGFAYGDVRDNGTLGATPFAASSVRTGWTAGAGLEYAITHNLTAKAEYLYTDLGSLSTPVAGSTVSTHAAFHAVRAGLNWKFDWTGAPVPINSKY